MGKRKHLITLLLLFVLPQIIFPQTNPEKFIKALINNSDNVKDFVDESELTRSERLGITYTGVKNKFLISYDIDEQVKSDMKEGRLQYNVTAKPLEENYSLVEFSVPALKYSKLFYFHNDKFISPSAYFTRNWQTKESKYFIFKISEPKYFNDYCINRLDEFVDMIADTLGFTQIEKDLLRKQKIYYIFCKDEEEVQALTGYKSKGQAILAFDEVITAYQTHFHELAHLLINYKLKNLGLYTLPFIMEGFAVAMGGRGGMAPRVVTDVGYYLQKTGFLTYDSIITNESFLSQDANMTYAVAGYYNTFLFNELGANKYLELYKKVNGDLEYVKRIRNSDFVLPNNVRFDNFQTPYEQSFPIKPEKLGLLEYNSKYDVIVLCYYKLVEQGKYYYFNTTTIGANAIEDSTNLGNYYVSRLFESISKGRYVSIENYHAKYFLIADSSSVRIYNCFNDELIASYDLNFSVEHKTISFLTKNRQNESTWPIYTFSVLSDVFNKELYDDPNMILYK